MEMHAAIINNTLASCNLNSNTKSYYFSFRTDILNAYLVPMLWKKHERLEEEEVCVCLLQTAELSRLRFLGFMYDAHSFIRECGLY